VAGDGDALWTTQPEPRRWCELWTQEGFAVTGTTYHRVKGRLPHDHLKFGDATVNGVVVNALDDLMHSSELFGDAQLLANLDVWADNGFLFFGSIAAAVGRQTHLDGAADRKSLRAVARSTFGEREFIDAGASKSLATMRNLGVLEVSKDGPYRVGSRLLVPPRSRAGSCTPSLSPRRPRQSA
jgi:hypothetical protein